MYLWSEALHIKLLQASFNSSSFGRFTGDPHSIWGLPKELGIPGFTNRFKKYILNLKKRSAWRLSHFLNLPTKNAKYWTKKETKDRWYAHKQKYLNQKIHQFCGPIPQNLFQLSYVEYLQDAPAHINILTNIGMESWNKVTRIYTSLKAFVP